MEKIIDINAAVLAIRERHPVALNAEEARGLREMLLSETDGWAVTDRIMTQSQIDYRQALRDLPAQPGFPNTVVWPTKP